jgi:hypothetical protein
VTRFAALAALLLLVPAAPSHAADPRPAVPTLAQVAQVSPDLRGGESDVRAGSRRFDADLEGCREGVVLPRAEARTTASYVSEGRQVVVADVDAVRMASGGDARRVVAEFRRTVRECPTVDDGSGLPLTLTDLTGRAGGVGQQRTAFRVEYGTRLVGVFVVARRGRTVVLTDVVRSGREQPSVREGLGLARLALRTAR